jgi:hypothetical protein
MKKIKLLVALVSVVLIVILFFIGCSSKTSSEEIAKFLAENDKMIIITATGIVTDVNAKSITIRDPNNADEKVSLPISDKVVVEVWKMKGNIGTVTQGQLQDVKNGNSVTLTLGIEESNLTVKKIIVFVK